MCHWNYSFKKEQSQHSGTVTTCTWAVLVRVCTLECAFMHLFVDIALWMYILKNVKMVCICVCVLRYVCPKKLLSVGSFVSASLVVLS